MPRRARRLRLRLLVDVERAIRRHAVGMLHPEPAVPFDHRSLPEVPFLRLDWSLILPYQREWPEQFVSLGRELRNALRDLALRIDHIGSTSVPGLAAKDVLDIQVKARALTTEVDDAVNGAGYERLTHITRDHVPPGGAEDPEQWSKWFYNQRGDGRRVNLHVRVVARANHHAGDVEAYYAIKDPVCDVIMGGAEAWAANVGWAPGPSDQ